MEQGHKVRIAYMTSGNVAVFDYDARRFVDFVDEFPARSAHRRSSRAPRDHQGARVQVPRREEARRAGQPRSAGSEEGDSRHRSAGRPRSMCGIPPEQLEFMDLRFYHTGTKTKKPIHPKDIEDVVELLKRLNPYQVYVAGELSDPHGTHRVCAEAVYNRGAAGRAAGLSPDVWLYKAREEWEPHEIEMAVPAVTGGVGAEEAGDLPAPEPEGQSDVPGRHRPRASSWQPRRGAKPRHRPHLRRARDCRNTTRSKPS